MGLIGDDLSSGGGFDNPPVPVEAGWDILVSNQVESTIELNATWSTTPVTVSLPLRLWNSRCLILNGMADAVALKKELGGREDLMEVDENPYDGPMYLEKKGSGQAHVQLYGSDYVGTTLGPFKAIFNLVRLTDDPTTKLPRFIWWLYYGTSLVNKEFKEQVWGIKPNRLAAIETAYAGRRKAVRLLEKGQPALEMVWNSARFEHLVEAARYFKFQTVATAPRHNNNGENEVELGVIQLKRGDAHRFDFPYQEAEGDKCVRHETTELGDALHRVNFEPKAWECLLDYGGVVKIYDEHGSGTRPSQPPPAPPSP
jgi:hypothetical protein